MAAKEAAGPKQSSGSEFRKPGRSSRFNRMTEGPRKEVIFRFLSVTDVQQMDFLLFRKRKTPEAIRFRRRGSDFRDETRLNSSDYGLIPLLTGSLKIAVPLMKYP